MADLYAPASDLPPIDRIPLWKVIACSALGLIVATLAVVAVS